MNDGGTRAVTPGPWDLRRHEPEPPDRSPEMSGLVVIGVLLVLLGHSDPTLTDGIAWEGHAFKRLVFVIYSFHMPLFFAVSGWLFADSTSRRGGTAWGDFFRRKAVRLLVPYLVINLAAYPIKAALSRYTVRPVEWGFEPLLHSLLQPGDAPVIYLWFLPAIFTAFLTGPAAWRLLQWKPWIGAAVLVVAGILLTRLRWIDLGHRYDFGWFAWRRSVELLVFFWLGMILWLPSLPFRRLPFPFLAVPGAVAWYLGFRMLPRPDLTGTTLMGFGGVLVLQGVVRQLVAMGLSFSRGIERASFTIFLLSWFPQVGAKALLGTIIKAGYGWTALGMFAAGLAVPWAVARHLRARQPRWAWILGQ